jgi:transcriptional regulator with XRE-family HTH domain
MSGSWTQTLLEELSDKGFRDAYTAEDIKIGIASQIRALREARGWSQSELGQHTGKPQSAISRLEDPDYGRLSLKTLKELASAFDVALLVRFVSFSELVAWNRDLSPQALAVPEFAQDDALWAQVPRVWMAEPAEVSVERENVVQFADYSQTESEGDHRYESDVEQGAGTSPVTIKAA